MKATISLDSLWQTIQSLTISDQKWLLERLYENIEHQEEEYISKEEILAGIRSGLEDAKAAMDGKIELPTIEDFLYELENESHN